VNHGLLIARLVVGEELRILGQRLADPREVAVAEDAEAAAYEAARKRTSACAMVSFSVFTARPYAGSGSITSRTSPARSVQAAMN